MINKDSAVKLTLAVGLGRRAYRHLLLMYLVLDPPARCKGAVVVDAVICVN